MSARIDAATLHERLRGGAWTAVLAQMGVGEEFLRGKKHPGPCPLCGGRDRYVYDDRHGRGDYFCRHCGAGDGLSLVQKLFGLTFSNAVKRVAEIAGILSASDLTALPARQPSTQSPAEPTSRVRSVLRGCCNVADVRDARDYLASRRLWPVPSGCTLRAHASLEYWEGRERIGRFAAIVADVCDVAGERVTAHVTYLDGGHKLTEHEPRKILSPLTGRAGCAVRLMPVAGDVLGIAEGLETALSASALHESLPTWSALNSGLLAKFEPPPEVRRLVVFADRDEAGLLAAARLMERLQGRVSLEVRAPPPPAKDWNDLIRSPV